MMQLNSFENEMSETILQRGKSYYKDGAVTSLEGMDNGQWFAIVEGNDDYEVDVRLSSDGAVLKYSCNCPYDSGICKHIVAVLYKIRDEIAPVTKLSKKTKEQVPWKNVISIIPEDELRKFLEEYAAKNQDFRNVLMVRFADYDKRDNRDKYKQVLNGIFRVAGDRHGYIDYHDTFGAMQQVFELLAKAEEYIEAENYKEAFYITAAIAPSCINALQNMDDSNGGCGGAINDAFEIISKILSSDASNTLKNETFDWLLGEAENSDYDDYGCADKLYPLLVEAVDSIEKATRILAFLDDQLQKVALKEGWSKEYSTKKFLSLKMDVLKKSGKEEKAADIISDNMHIHDFRKIVVEKHIMEHNFDEAIHLIQEGIGIATKEDYAGVMKDWKEMLMDIYQKQNNVLELRAIAKDLYYSVHYEKKYYLEYKSTFGKEEWSQELEKIISNHKKGEKSGSYQFQSIPSHLAAVYIEEKLWDELYGLLQKSVNVQSLIQYSQYLVNGYAPELILMYKNAIDRVADRPSDRRGYKEIALYILKMSEIPGGKEPARLFVNRLMEKYNKRPAMKDELTKISNL